MKTLILFDNGGVLTSVDFDPVHRELEERTGLLTSEIKAKLSESNAVHYGITGQNEEFFQRYKTALGLNLSEKEMVEFQTSKACLQPIPEIIDIKKRLASAGYAVGILSNSFSFVIDWENALWPEILETFGGPEIYSDRLGIAKPDPAIYQGLDEFEKIIYVEDKTSFLKYPVENMGWIGILLTQFQYLEEAWLGDKKNEIEGLYTANSSEQLEHVLKDLGLEF